MSQKERKLTERKVLDRKRVEGGSYSQVRTGKVRMRNFLGPILLLENVRACGGDAGGETGEVLGEERDDGWKKQGNCIVNC